ncbi:MAG: sensor histidine kinase [Bacillota bacterium]
MMKIEQFKTQPLWLRLVFFFLLLSAIIMLLFQVIFNYSLDRHLQTYTREREETLNRQIISSLLGYYEASGSWSGIHMPLLHAALSTGTRMLLYDSDGRLVGDTGQGRHRMMMAHAQQPELRDVNTYHYELKQHSNMIGELIIAHPITVETSAMFAQDLYFRRAITRSMFWIGLIAVAAATVLGIIFSRRLSRPMEEMAGVASSITRGDYSLQLPTYEGREINVLAGSFNRMSAHLQNLELLRKRSVADISHELRTPLTTLRSYIEAVRDGVLPADTKTMEILLEEIMHLNRVAADIDELARAENIKEGHTSLETINLNQVIHDKVSSFLPFYQDRGLTLNLNLPEKNITTCQDPAALGKIISNLLENAYRYSEPGGKVDVILNDDPEFDDGAVSPLGQKIPSSEELKAKLADMILIKVTDTGIGIKEEYLPYIFERFFRADPSREKEQSQAGSGIGLALVKELTRASGGYILVSSQPGKGTTFYLYLKK